jgi:hypothetical protein
MRIIKVLERIRNDFHWLGKCEHCGYETRYGDGYADEYYCLTIVPHRYCDKCGLNSHGEKDEQYDTAN